MSNTVKGDAKRICPTHMPDASTDRTCPAHMHGRTDGRTNEESTQPGSESLVSNAGEKAARFIPIEATE